MPHGASGYASFYAPSDVDVVSSDAAVVVADNVTPTAVWGYIAVSLSLIYKVPQIVHLYRTRDVKALSITSQLVQASAYIFYMVHGTIVDDKPVVLLGVASLLQSLVLIFQYYRYRGEATAAAAAADNAVGVAGGVPAADKRQRRHSRKHKKNTRRPKRTVSAKHVATGDTVFSSSDDDAGDPAGDGEGGVDGLGAGGNGRQSMEMATIV